MKIPIVIAAFGTTTRALDTYAFMDNLFKARFPNHDIIWSYSSRMVKDWIKERKNIVLKHPHQVLAELAEEGHTWAVVQSLHLISGHEFYRLTEEVRTCGIRTSVGLPLLCAPEDYMAVADVFGSYVSLPDSHAPEALVMVGHGTDHPSWSSYLALQHALYEKAGREKSGSGIYVGVVEHGFPSQEEIVAAVKNAGYKRVRLMPFMMVAGVHFKEDMIGDEEDSWKTAFESEGIAVSVETKGIGYFPGIAKIFCNHIQDALDVIPSSITTDIKNYETVSLSN